MTVEIDEPLSLKGKFILKMYDRRFAHELRHHAGTSSWNPDIERKYREFLEGDSALPFFKFCSETDFIDLVLDYLPDWDEQQLEAYLQYTCRKFYNAEREVYRRLQDRQGIDIPRFFGEVEVSSLCDSTELDREHLDCPGILLEIVHGFPLSDLAEHAPREAWQEICDEAIRMVISISDRGIRNEDVKPRNIIVRKNKDAGEFKPVIIDFARCAFRKEGQDNNDWEYQKVNQDEEGAIGAVMEKKLQGGFRYQRSEESLRLHYKFKSG